MKTSIFNRRVIGGCFRYVSFAHFARQGRGAEIEKTFLQSLNKALNSLSWRPWLAVAKPVAGRTDLFRISLPDYGWSVSDWDLILKNYPYRKLTTPSLTAGQANQWVRGDWLVYQVVRPPLYHELLKLPTQASELEESLGLSVANAIRSGQVQRAGFRGSVFSGGSGVSKNNRLIERHSTRYGAYWKSYDFRGNRDEQNLFLFPLGPDAGPFGFKHAGGEIIFNLPNGLQAYLLVDDQGHRLDVAPTDIVQDGTRLDAKIVNGISCMSCHSQGMRNHADEILNFANGNESRFTSVALEKIRAIYPKAEAFQKLLDQDSSRFVNAIEKLGVTTTSRVEPVRITTDDYEKPLALATVAGELGFSTADFEKILSASPRLESFRAQLLAGGLTREEMESRFLDLQNEVSHMQTRRTRALSGFAPLSLISPDADLRRSIEVCDPLSAHSAILAGAKANSPGLILQSLQNFCEAVALELLPLHSDDELNLQAEKESTLHVAIGIGALRFLQETILRPGVRLSGKNRQGDLALHLALRLENSEAALILLSERHKSQAQINTPDPSKVPPLIRATVTAQTLVVQELLSFPGIDVEQKDRSGRTALDYATALAREQPGRHQYHEIKQALSAASGGG